jgi:hypothetical protein
MMAQVFFVDSGGDRQMRMAPRSKLLATVILTVADSVSGATSMSHDNICMLHVP